MPLASKPVRAWFAFWIWLLYFGGLRRRLNTLQRRLQREGQEARLPLAELSSVDELRKHLKPFQYRADKARSGLPLDYISDSRIFEARLRSGSVLDGDCDDFHHYVAVQLERLGYTAWHVSIGYQGGGHVACVYCDSEQRHWLWNYGSITELESGSRELAFLDAGEKLRQWATKKRETRGDKGPARLRWLIIETTKLERVKLEFPHKVKR